MMRKNITQLLALTLVVGLGQGCKKKGGGGESTATPTEAAKQKEAAAQAKAEEDFAKAVAVYDKAMADGSISGDECGKTAGAFERVAKSHGERMMIAEFNAAAIHESCGDKGKAKKMYEGLAKKNFHLALNNLGVMYWNEGNTKKAMEYFEKSVAADKKLAFAARNNLAAGLRERYTSADKPDKSVFEKAELQIQNVLAVDTSNRGAYENLARLYYDRGRLADRSYLLLAGLVVSQAITVLKEAGEESADLYNLAGLLRMQEDDQIEALKAFKRATAVNATHTDANLNIAFISIRFRDYESAEKSLDIALKDPKQSQNFEAVLAMGVAKRGLKKYAEAEEFYVKASKLQPKDPRPHYNLGILQHEHVSGTKEDSDAQEAVFKVAKKHYSKFVSLAGSGKKYKELVDDAKGRMLVIDDAIVAFRQAEKMAAEAKRLEELEKKQAAEERKRLLDMEKAAEAEAEAAEKAASAEAAKPKEEPKKDDAKKEDDKKDK
jgi:tetratricopeptide (TPR) repeat protein